MNAQDFLDSHNGSFWDFDGYYGAQCVDLAQFYAQWLGNPRFWGNAINIYDQAGSNYQQIPNTPDGVPQLGDIVVFDEGYGGGFGHVAIANGNGDASYFHTLDQNWVDDDGNTSNGSKAAYVLHDYSHVKGWLRPFKLIPPPPATVPAPAPEPEPTPVELPPAEPTPVVNVPIVEATNEGILLERLKSRKFWVAVASSVYFLIHGDIMQAYSIILAYLGIQGIIDHKEAGQ